MAKVLVIDSEYPRLNAVSLSLAQSGISVLTCDCAVSGLESVLAWRPALTLIVEQPFGLDVLDVLGFLRAMNDVVHTATMVFAPSPRRKLEYFRAGSDEFILLPADEAEILFRICALLRRLSPPGISGDFSNVSLFDFIQMLVQGNKTGKLELRCGDKTACLFFLEGQAMHAGFEEQKGEEAFLSILRSALGGAEFHFGEIDGEIPVKNLERRTDHLLLNLASVLDEERLTGEVAR